MAFDGKAFGDEMVAVVRSFVERESTALRADMERENAALRAANEALAARLAAVEARDVAGVLQPQIEAIARAVDALPAPPDVSGFVTREAMEQRIAEIPEAEPADMSGFATKAELAEVRSAIPEQKETVDLAPILAALATKDDLAEVRAAIPEPSEPVDLSALATKDDLAEVRAAIPTLPEPADLSRFATKADVEAVLEAMPDLSPYARAEAVQEALDALPQPKDYDEPLAALTARMDALRMPEVIHGKDVDPDEVRAMVEEAVSVAVAAIPPAENGKDADPDVIARMIADALPSREELRGPPGRLPVAKAWADGVHYEGDVVTHAGAMWQATKDTGREPPHGDWIMLAGRGADGLSWEPMGTFDEAAEYRRLDVVALNAGSFVALRDKPGPCPGEGWQLLAGRGKPGPSVKGDKGNPGDDATEVAGFYRSGDEIVLTLADGREFRA